MSERKVLGWAVKRTWGAGGSDHGSEVRDGIILYSTRDRRLLLTEGEARRLAEKSRAHWEGEATVTVVRVVAKSKAPELCMLSRAPNGLEYCRLPKGHGGPVHIDFGEGWSNPWLTNGTRLVPESDPKPDRLELAITMGKARAALARQEEDQAGRVRHWETATNARSRANEMEFFLKKLEGLR